MVTTFPKNEQNRSINKPVVANLNFYDVMKYLKIKTKIQNSVPWEMILQTTSIDEQNIKVIEMKLKEE